jgi:predicted RND superfamily exporter protein
METFGLIVILGVGIAIGMYITTQISEHIDRRTRHKKFLKDMENFDNKKK